MYPKSFWRGEATCFSRRDIVNVVEFEKRFEVNISMSLTSTNPSSRRAVLKQLANDVVQILLRVFYAVEIGIAPAYCRRDNSRGEICAGVSTDASHSPVLSEIQWCPYSDVSPTLPLKTA